MRLQSGFQPGLEEHFTVRSQLLSGDTGSALASSCVSVSRSVVPASLQPCGL